MSKQQTKRTTASTKPSQPRKQTASAAKPEPVEPKSVETPQNAPQTNEQEGTDPKGVVVPAGTLEERLVWVAEAETQEERSSRADAVYAHERDADGEAFDGEALGAALTKAVYGGAKEVAPVDDESEDDEQDDEDIEDDEESDKEDAPVQHRGAPKGKLLEAGEAVTFDGTVEGNQVRVNEDVYRVVYPRNTKRPSFILLYRAGTLVPQSAFQKTN